MELQELRNEINRIDGEMLACWSGGWQCAVP